MSNKPAYQWKDHARHTVPAPVAAAEIDRIRAIKGVWFQPADLVDASRPRAAPLHHEFVWDNRVAGERWREKQAGDMIRHIVVIDQEETRNEPIRAYVSVHSRDDGHRYTSTAEAFADPDLRERVLAQALMDMQSFVRRYSQFMDLAKVMTAFEAARAKAAVRAPAMAD